MYLFYFYNFVRKIWDGTRLIVGINPTPIVNHKELFVQSKHITLSGLSIWQNKYMWNDLYMEAINILKESWYIYLRDKRLRQTVELSSLQNILRELRAIENMSSWIGFEGPQPFFSHLLWPIWPLWHILTKNSIFVF